MDDAVPMEEEAAAALANVIAEELSDEQSAVEESIAPAPISKKFILTARAAAEGAYSDAHHDFAQGWLYHGQRQDNEPLDNRPTLDLLDFNVDKSIPIKTELAGRVGHKPEDRFLFDNLFDEKYFNTLTKRTALGDIFDLCNMSKTGEEMKDLGDSPEVPG